MKTFSITSSNENIWEIEYYVLSNGKKPFYQRLIEIRDTTTQNRIIQRINRMELNNFGDSQSVGNGVCELRLHFGPGYRVYYAKIDIATILILYLGDKSRQPDDIDYAKRCLSQYKNDRRG